MKTFVDKDIETLNYKVWLAEEFTKRCTVNSRYSLRAFSDYLGLDASSVSQIISGKRHISEKMLKKLCSALNVDSQKEKALLSFFKYESVKRKVGSDEIQEITPRELTQDAFAIISDWYHYAILELLALDNFKYDNDWIADQLNIESSKVNEAIERLLRLGLLVELNGKLLRTHTFLTNFSKDMSTDALKKMQRSILNMGLKAIDSVTKEEKDITGMTMAINEKKLPQARDLIKKFRRDLMVLMEQGEQTRVYHLGVQLYPVSKKNN